MKFLTFLILSTILITSCNKIKNQNTGTIINLNKNIQNHIKYSYFTDSISYIPLETNDSCLIAKVKDIQMTDSFIFVLDQKQPVIFVFNQNGQFVNKIDRQGQGPGEYGWITQFYYNKHRNSISVCSAAGSCKIIEYNINGDFINEFYTNYFVGDLYQFPNGDYLLSRIGRTDKPKTALILCDSKGSIKKEILSYKKEYAIDSSDNWELEVYNNSINFISPQLDNVIYTYDNDTLKRTIKFEIQPVPTKDFYKTRYDVLGLGPYFFRTVYKESSKWIYLTYYSTEKGLRILLYNKETSEFVIGEDTYNDIDHKKFIAQTSASENNTFTYCIEGEEDCNPIIQILHLK